MAAAIFAVACGNDDTPTGTAAVVSVTVLQPKGRSSVGATTTLTATTKDGSGASHHRHDLSSSDAIATVSPSGVVTGVAAGNGDNYGDEQRKDREGDGDRELEDRDLQGDAWLLERGATNTSTGTGTFHGDARYHDESFTYDVTFTGLTSNVTLGHIHGPAAAGVNAGTTINFATFAGATFSLGATAGRRTARRR